MKTVDLMANNAQSSCGMWLKMDLLGPSVLLATSGMILYAQLKQNHGEVSMKTTQKWMSLVIQLISGV